MKSRDKNSPAHHRLCAALRTQLNAKPLTDRALVEGGRILLQIKECNTFLTGKTKTFGQFCAREPSIESARFGRRLLRIGRWLQPQEVVLTHLQSYGLEALTLIRERHPKASLAPALCDGELRFSEPFLALCKTAREAADAPQADAVLEAGLRELAARRGRSAGTSRKEPPSVGAAKPAPERPAAAEAPDAVLADLRRRAADLPAAQAAKVYAVLDQLAARAQPGRCDDDLDDPGDAGPSSIEEDQEGPAGPSERRGADRDAPSGAVDAVPADHPLSTVLRTARGADPLAAPGRPQPLSSDDLVLAVPYPDGEVQELDDADRRSAELITALYALFSVRDAIRGFRIRFVRADCLLQLRLVRATARLRALVTPLRAALAPALAAAREDYRAEHPDLGDDDLPLPLSVAAALDAACALPEDVIAAAPTPGPELCPLPDPVTAPDSPHPLGYLLIPCPDPLGDDAPTVVERLAWRALGLLEHLQVALPAWVAAREALGVRSDLLYQVGQGLRRANLACMSLQSEFNEGSREGLSIESDTGSRAADLAYAPGSERPVTVLGAREPGALHATIAIDEDGDPVVLNLNVPHFVLAFGEKGTGKSTLTRIVAESIHLALPRLCHHDLRGRPNPFRSLSVAVHAQHRGRLEGAKGFFPNPNGDHQAVLRAVYGSRSDNAAYHRGLLLCRPGQETLMHERHAAACERGLQTLPLFLSPADLDLFGYEALLSVGTREGDRPRALQVLPAILAACGPLTPDALLRELKKSRVHLGVLETQLLGLRDIVRPGPSLGELLRVCDGPMFLQLEGGGLGSQWLWSLAIVVMNALARSSILEEDRLHLWLLIEELSQMLMNPQARAFLTLFGRETRHGRMSLCGGGQHLANVTGAILSLLSGIFLFKLPPGELAILRGILRWVEGLHAAALARLTPGQVYCAFNEASDPRFCERAQFIHLRPTATWAGGETVTVL